MMKVMLDGHGEGSFVIEEGPLGNLVITCTETEKTVIIFPVRDQEGRSGLKIEVQGDVSVEKYPDSHYLFTIKQ